MLVRAVFLACRMPTSSCVLICLRWRGRETDRERGTENSRLSLLLLIRALITLRGSSLMTSSNPNYYPKTLYPNTILLGFRDAPCEFGGREDIDLHSIKNVIFIFPELFLLHLETVPHTHSACRCCGPQCPWCQHSALWSPISKSSWTGEFSVSIGNYKMPDV